MIKRLSCVLALSLVAACGSLEVQMDVLNPSYVEYLREEHEIRETLRLIIHMPKKYVSEQLTELNQRELDAYSQTAATYRKEAKSLDVNDTVRESLLTAAADSLKNGNQTQLVNNRYKETCRTVARLHKSIMEVVNSIEHDALGRMLQGSEDLDPRLVGLISLRNEAIRSLIARVDTELERVGLEVSAKLIGTTIASSIIKAVRDVAAMTANELVWGASLHNDPVAYAVASAPDAKWGKEYNRAFGRGDLGNLHIAIKLTHKGDFTIKGMTFDPSKIAQMASKATTQVVLLAARIYGVPVSTGTDTQGNSDDDIGVLTGDDQQLVADEQTIMKRQKTKEDFNKALLLIARSILDESEALVHPDSNTRKEAVEAIGVTYSSHKSRLIISIAEPD